MIRKPTGEAPPRPPLGPITLKALALLTAAPVYCFRVECRRCSRSRIVKHPSPTFRQFYCTCRSRDTVTTAL